MPTTFGSQIRSVADIVQTVTKCSKVQADAAEAEICNSPENKAKMAIACGLAAGAISASGVLLYTAPATGGTGAIAALALGGAGALAAKRFCSGFVKTSTPDK
ncbi:MAG: hypothetical protein WAS72_04490 [Saprospiraceae bacterium]